MAVSSSLRGNVFDILMGLPLPWFLYTAIVQFGKEDRANIFFKYHNLNFDLVHNGVVGNYLVHWSSWRLTVNLGWAMMVLYFIFVIQSVHLI